MPLTPRGEDATPNAANIGGEKFNFGKLGGSRGNGDDTGGPDLVTNLTKNYKKLNELVKAYAAVAKSPGDRELVRAYVAKLEEVIDSGDRNQVMSMLAAGVTAMYLMTGGKG
jgi:hypothetical protein